MSKYNFIPVAGAFVVVVVGFVVVGACVVVVVCVIVVGSVVVVIVCVVVVAIVVTTEAASSVVTLSSVSATDVEDETVVQVGVALSEQSVVVSTVEVDSAVASEEVPANCVMVLDGESDAVGLLLDSVVT